MNSLEEKNIVDEDRKSFFTESFSFIDYTELSSELKIIVWESRNLPEIRKFMSDTKAIPYNKHIEFIDKLCSDKSRRYFAVLCEHKFCGSINLTFKENHSVEREIYIHPAFHRQGLAKKISKELYRYLYYNCDIRTVYTKVLICNKASIALQLSLGSSLIRTDSKYNYRYKRLDRTNIEKGANFAPWKQGINS